MADTQIVRDSIPRKMRDMGDGTFAEVVHALPAIGDSTGVGGSVTAPGALGAFVTVAAPPAGIYDVSFGYFLTGTAETVANNVRLRKATVAIMTPMPSVSATAPITDDVKRVTLDGTQALQLIAIGAATAGAIYSGWIVATKIG